MIKGDTITDTIKLFEKTNYTFATYSKSKWWYLDDKCIFLLEPCSGKAWNIVEQHESNLDFVWSVTAAGPGCRIYQTRLIRSLGATRKSTKYSPNQTDSNKCSRWNMFPITLNNPFQLSSSSWSLPRREGKPRTTAVMEAKQPFDSMLQLFLVQPGCR